MGMSGWERGVLAALALAIVAGVVLAVGLDRERLRQLAATSAAATFVLVVFGAWVRLNDAGLGCPDWPGCYGALTPAQSTPAIEAEQARHPTGPVSVPKAWKEMLHRYLAMIVGCLIVALAIAAFRARHRFDSAPGLAAATLAVVLLQGAFGALTVTLLLKPAIVTMHLLGGLTILALLTWTARRLARPRPADRAAQRLRGVAMAAAVVLLVQLALGGWVSTNYAAAACGDLPRCQQSWLPPVDFGVAFHPWRELGRAADDSNLPLAGLTAIHLAHRGFAVVALLALLALAWRAARARATARLGVALGAAVLLQVALGIGIVVAMSPDHVALAAQLPFAAAHNAGAALLVTLVTVINSIAWSGRSAAAAVRTRGSAATWA